MKRIAIFTFLLFFVSSFVFAQVSWYVTGTGNDSNAGKSEKTAFRTLQKAAELVEPGDVVYVGDGVIRVVILLITVQC